MIDGLCKKGLVDEAFKIFEMMKGKGKQPDTITYNMLLMGLSCHVKVDEAMKLFSVISKDENLLEPDEGFVGKAIKFLRHALDLGLVLNGITYGVLINGFCKTHMLRFAKGLFSQMRAAGVSPTVIDYNVLMVPLCKENMIACGVEPDAFVFDSLLKGYCLKGDTEEIVNLLHQMADKGVVLDSEITSTILECLSEISDDVDVMKILPTFSQETSKGASITCDELLVKLNNSHPELRLYAA
ncbi:hypothetical protein TB2_019519 [Malus domestica]